MEFEVHDIVTRILKMSDKIRVVTICDMKGKLIYTARSPNVELALSPKESNASLTRSARNMGDRKKLAKQLGTCLYTLAEYEKVKRLVVPASNRHLFYITCLPDYDHRKIIKKIESFKIKSSK